jgi:hypothetical protein
MKNKLNNILSFRLFMNKNNINEDIGYVDDVLFKLKDSIFNYLKRNLHNSDIKTECIDYYNYKDAFIVSANQKRIKKIPKWPDFQIICKYIENDLINFEILFNYNTDSFYKDDIEELIKLIELVGNISEPYEWHDPYNMYIKIKINDPLKVIKKLNSY